jgi:DNA gyrase/topoisomerase IV subunit B
MIEVIKNILPYKINNKIILLLVKSTNWYIGKECGDDEKLLIELLETTGNSHGMSLETFNGPQNTYTNSPLNNYAEIIYEIVKNHTKYKFLKPVRFYWNYYNQSSCAIPHTDSNKNYFVSFVYNLNTNNGGTNINGEFFKSVAGEAIVFKSNILHNSVAQSDVKGRFNLNCIVELERNI